MEKYTVDLDQVLNDFEYSEFTSTEQSAPRNVIPTSVNRNSFRKTDETIAKHSMNNVFHSLNEYLGSDIVETKEEEQDNDDLINNNNDTEDNLIDNTEDNENLIINIETDDLVMNENCKSLVLKEIENDKMENLIDSSNSENLSPKIEFNAQNSKSETIDINKEKSAIQSDDIRGYSNENSVIQLVNTEEICNEKTEELNDNEEINERSGNLIPNIEDNKEIEPEEIYPIKTIGFDNDNEDDDISDEELDDTLNALEVKYEKNNKNTEIEEENIDEKTLDCNAGENSENCNIISRPTQLDITINETNGGNIQEINDKKTINLIGEPGSTPYNNEYDNGITNTKNTFEEKITESTTPSPTVSQQSNETSSTQTSTPSIDTITALPTQPLLATPPTDDSGDLQEIWLGKRPPIWIPDAEAQQCMHCEQRFTVLKRRHHCRACGFVLCNKCCSQRMRLEYLIKNEIDVRVCMRCYDIISTLMTVNNSVMKNEVTGTTNSPSVITSPNPNNPSEYCSTIPPQMSTSSQHVMPVPSVMVPVGVLKKHKSISGIGTSGGTSKSVMFCDGIRPGSDLTVLDDDGEVNEFKRVEETTTKNKLQHQQTKRRFLQINKETKSFMSTEKNSLPPIVIDFDDNMKLGEFSDYTKLRTKKHTFCLNLNLLIHVKIVNMECCTHKFAWCFTTEGMMNIGQDELVILLELTNEDELEPVPRDIFFHLNHIYLQAIEEKISLNELDISLNPNAEFLDSKNHAGFIFIKPTFQCLQNLILPPDEPYLIGLLFHRWETPWAKLFPLRLVLRLGAEYRYYPCPLVSYRHRDSLFVEVGHTIINLLADFRNYAYSLPQIPGLTIHMEDKKTTIQIPKSQYKQIVKSIQDSENILAFAGNFSKSADSHLVCIQNTLKDENTITGGGVYSTHAINIQNKPRKITGASFVIFNGALKQSSGLKAKSSIIEDGLMVQISSEHMVQLRESLNAMKNFTIHCGYINNNSNNDNVNAENIDNSENEQDEEIVEIIWDNQETFNSIIKSPINGEPLSAVQSIRVRNFNNNNNQVISASGSYLLRWTEVFIIQNTEICSKYSTNPVDILKIAENISEATGKALVKYLDLLVNNKVFKFSIRVTLHVENVSYSAGSNGGKLAPIYMKSLDNELIPLLHRISSNHQNFQVAENTVELELIFRILRN